MSLNATKLASDIASSFIGVLKGKVPDIKDYAVGEAKKFAQAFVTIEKLVLSGKISKKSAKLHLEIQKNSAQIVFLTIEGLGLLAVEGAINAAMNVIKDTVNKALGFALI